MLTDWLQHLDPARKDRIHRLGLLTGLRREKSGSYRPANFERALVLQRLIALCQPDTMLELGTGRGLGCLAAAQAARDSGIECEITTVDITPPTQPIPWAIELGGEQRELRASLDEIWGKHIDADLRRHIRLRTGPTTRVLPELARERRKFDLIFIDAGHDLFSVIHDLSYAAVLLAEGGAILMDDFAPLEEFGLGTCVAVAHARRWFAHVETFATEGLVYGGAVHPEAPRGMVFLQEPREKHPHVQRGKLLWWRVAGAFLERCYRPGLFPLAKG